LFREHCASCHQAKGLGVAVGPNLDSEHQRAEETILRDLLLPSEIIRPGFETYWVQNKRGGSYYGILAAESPTSVTLRLPSGDELTLLRKRIDRARSHKVSLMPATFAQTLEPAAAADIIAFLRAP
jgi:putative heme-binding domain-containing protein